MHHGKQSRQQQSQQEQQRCGCGQRLHMVKDGTLGQDAAVLKTNHRYKEAYTGGKGIFQRGGHHLEDDLSQVAYAYQHKQQSLYQYRRQGKLPGVAHGQAYRFNKKGVQR